MRLKLLIMLMAGLLALPITAQQDEEMPAPEFLYRDGDTLVLVNGYTGETYALPLVVTYQLLSDVPPL